jgi:phosphohistidine swiveling domain-containing protein
MQGLISKNIEWMKRQEWYLQRFDACPNYLHALVDGELMPEERKGPVGNFKSHIVLYENDTADYYHNLKEIRDTGNWVIEQIKKDRNFITNLMKKWEQEEKTFIEYFEKHKFYNYEQMSDEELLEEYKQLTDLYAKTASSTSLIDGFVFAFDEYLEKNNIKVEFPQIKSFMIEEEEDLRKTNDLKKHQEKYFWLRNNYADAKILDVKFFEEKKKSLKEITPVTKEKNSEDNLTQSLPYWAKWQDTRKKYTFWATHLFDKILTVMSKRKNIPKNNLKYMLRQEILANKIDLKRYPLCLFFEKDGEYEFMPGSEGKQLFESIIKSQIKDFNIVRGTPANKGKFKGKAVIVKSSKEAHKVKEGDVLFAVMTRPDYMVGIKKAGAIVTDEGGVTCHAAIVSREFNKPCIIGTKNATKIFKDGDLVEVDAYKGEIRKL